LDWVTGTWYNHYCKVLDSKGITGWREDFDCDDWAHAFKVEMQYAHKKACVNSEGIACGVVYDIISRSGHAINVVITEGGVTFTEPQTGRVLDLTDQEVGQIWFVLF
jgi:hypothetical protein